MFDPVIPGALVITALTVLFTAAVKSLVPSWRKRSWGGPLVFAAACGFLFGLLLTFLDILWGHPVRSGLFGGWEWLVVPLLVASLLTVGVGFGLGGLLGWTFVGVKKRAAQSSARSSTYNRRAAIDADDPSRGERFQNRLAAGRLTGRLVQSGGKFGYITGTGALVSLLFMTLVVWGIAGLILRGAYTWNGNQDALARLEHITEVNGTAQQPLALPPSDPQHLVEVTQSMAQVIGQKLVATQGNLGSQYQFNQDEWTLQSINHHLYYAAPLDYSYNGQWDWCCANWDNWQGQGYGLVDAENHNTPPQFKSYDLIYTNDAKGDRNVLNHLYNMGYTDVQLVDPTLEIDDNYYPYYTITAMVNSKVVDGPVVKYVLLLDAVTGQVTRYALDQAPAWVDRIIPQDVIKDRITRWGLNHALGWNNPNHVNQEQPAGDPELIYNDADTPVWLIPLTSTGSTDSASTGFAECSTRTDDCQVYRLRAYDVGELVTNTITGKLSKLGSQYTPALFQLYVLDGYPTYLCVVTQPVSANNGGVSGDSFAGIALVRANAVSTANVIFDPSMSQALNDYQAQIDTYLSTLGPKGNLPSGLGSIQSVTGTVASIDKEVENGNSVLYVLLDNDYHIYRVPLSLDPYVKFILIGHRVSFTYLDLKQPQVSVESEVDYSLHIPTPTPTPSASPGVTATPVSH